MDYLSKLNDKQREAAVHTEGPLLILAGAGSGKTSTMTHRIAYMIQEKGISPYSMLAVTFTNKAAKEMRDRVEELIGERVNMWILTFHSACLRILRVNAEKLGYQKDFVIYDPTDQKVIMKNLLKQHNVDEKRYSVSYLLSVVSDCKEKGLSPEIYMKENTADIRAKVVGPIYRDYEAALHSNNAMDFDDLIAKTVALLESDEETRSYYQGRFRYIMVDEYQDTNYMQYRFVKLLAQKHNNLCVVGDDDQCIYQWRGADIKNILSFEQDFKQTKVIKLEQNYRSYGNILKAAHSVIQHNYGRKDKKLWTQQEDGEKITYYRADDDREEARFVAAQIDLLHSGLRRGQGPEGSRLRQGKLHYSDFAILYRNNTQSRRFEDALRGAGIPYRMLSGFRYYDRKEVKDMMCYMRLVLNPSDDLSLARIINEPKRGIGEKTLEKLSALARVRGESLLAVLGDAEINDSLPAKSRSSIREMTAVLLELGEQWESGSMRVSDIYDSLLVRTGYLKSLESAGTVEAEGRIENLLEFKSAIYDAEKENPSVTLAEFMEQVALISEVDNHNPDEDAVVMMTMHSAKGLEFPVVFLPGMEDGLFPSWRSYDKGPDGVEEERRLCYVGMTRAREKLYLSSAETRTLYGKTDYTKESQFLREVDARLLEGQPVYSRRNPAQSSDRFRASAPFDGGYGFGGTGQYGGSRGFRSDDCGGASVNRPFAQIQKIKAQVAQSRAQSQTGPAVSGGRQAVAGGRLLAGGGTDGQPLAQGDSVSHPKFGKGLVIEATGSTLTVAFDAVGIKKLARDIAPLTKL